MNGSIAKLAESLGPDDFKLTKQLKIKGMQVSDEDLKLVMKKIPYPYTYLNSAERMAEPTPIDRQHFFNNLSNEEMTEEEYEVYKVICSRLNLLTNQDYHDLYLTLDVLLLSDIMERSRDIFS